MFCQSISTLASETVGSLNLHATI